LLALHSVTASYKRYSEWADLLGARFTGHGPVESLEIVPDAGNLLKGISPFFLKDEAYRHQLQSDCQIEAMVVSQGKSIPIAFSRRFEKGKIFYFGAGHRASTWNAAGSSQVLQCALNWFLEKENAGNAN
jgi:type 1 glutamine amidotransferase